MNQSCYPCNNSPFRFIRVGEKLPPWDTQTVDDKSFLKVHNLPSNTIIIVPTLHHI